MATTYPGAIQTYTNPSGTQTLASPDHASLHTTVQDTSVALQTTLGTTGGTAVLKNFVAGNFAARTNGETFGTPTVNVGSDATGDMYYRSSGSTLARLAGGTAAGKYLTTDGTTPFWGTVATSVPMDGWIEAAETWTFAGTNSRFGTIITGTVSMSRYDVGDKIKFLQSTQKYFSIIGTALGTAGTLTITGGTTHTLGTGAITSNYFSHEANPVGFPQYFSYLPTYGAASDMTFTGVTTTRAIFSIQGRSCHLRVYANGTTGGTASARIYFTNPVDIASTDNNIEPGAYAAVSDSSATSGYIGGAASGTFSALLATNANWGLGAGRRFTTEFTYNI